MSRFYIHELSETGEVYVREEGVDGDICRAYPRGPQTAKEVAKLIAAGLERVAPERPKETIGALYPVDPEDAPEGYVAEQFNGRRCNACVMWEKDGATGCSMSHSSEEFARLPCHGRNRKDGHAVLFVKREPEQAAEAELPECRNKTSCGGTE